MAEKPTGAPDNLIYPLHADGTEIRAINNDGVYTTVVQVESPNDAVSDDRMQLDLLQCIITELRILNVHLSTMTDEKITNKDV